MKTIINSSKRANYAWFNVGIILLICLLFLIIPSCQKDNGILLNQESPTGLDMILTSELSSNASILYYGPKTFTRTTGAPIVETQTIENPDFDNFNSQFVLIIQNGSDKKTRVSSAEIRIDGALIAGPSDFSKNVSLITKQISGLTPESILEVKLKSAPGSFIVLRIEGTLNELIVTDCEGNIYNTVTIGTQVWMKENLKTTKYNDGTSIPSVMNQSEWVNLTTPAYIWYNDDANIYKATYGALYNWYAVNTGKLCPTGWHVPTDTEWHTLILTIDADAQLVVGIESNIAGGKLKEAGLSHWESPNTEATNESGFTGLPGGFIWEFGFFDNIGFWAKWWSSTENYTGNAWERGLFYDRSDVDRSSEDERYGSSVRCIKD